MTVSKLSDTIEWQQLAQHATEMQDDRKHLRHLLADPDRLESFSLSGGGLFLDYSRQRVEKKTLIKLQQLAARLELGARFRAMVAGEEVNVTEKRAALHTAARDFSGQPVAVGGVDVLPPIRRVREEIRIFTHRIHTGELTGSTGKR